MISASGSSKLSKISPELDMGKAGGGVPSTVDICQCQIVNVVNAQFLLVFVLVWAHVAVSNPEMAFA